jgi:hypothetical protein
LEKSWAIKPFQLLHRDYFDGFEAIAVHGRDMVDVANLPALGRTGW